MSFHELPTFHPSRPAEMPGPRAVRAAADGALAALPPRGRITVVVNDPQRHTDSAAVLAALAGRLAGRVARVLVATGSHRFDAETRRPHESRLRQALGETGRDAEIAWHDADAPGVELPLPGGGNWKADPRLLEAEGILAVGSVEPHYFAGFTGAHKTCTIGCATREDIRRNHAHAVRPDARPTRLAGNPVAEGIRSMADSLASRIPCAAVNLVQAGEEVLAAFGGTLHETLPPAAEIAGRVFCRDVDAPQDAVVAEVPPPLGRSLYQADKGIQNTAPAVRDGGLLVLVAGCEEGLGQDAFCDLLRRAPAMEEVRALLDRRGYRLGDHKAVRLRSLTDPAGRGVRLRFVSPGLDAAAAALTGGEKAESVEAAFASARLELGRCRAARVLDAGNVVLRVRGGEEAAEI
jgi:nickel-dependent lactate racemase